MRPSLALAPNCFHPLGGASPELGVLFVFPRPSRSLQGSELAQARQLPGGGAGEKTTAASPADQRVNLADQCLGNDDVGALIHKRNLLLVGLYRHTRSLTDDG